MNNPFESTAITPTMGRPRAVLIAGIFLLSRAGARSPAMRGGVLPIMPSRRACFQGALLPCGGFLLVEPSVA